MNYTIKEERLTAEEYIEFLKHTDLGSQYPKERGYHGNRKNRRQHFRSETESAGFQTVESFFHRYTPFLHQKR